MPTEYVSLPCDAALTQSFSAVTAACLVVRKGIYEQVGGLNEELQVAFSDVDFCLRVREAGYRNVWTPCAELYHHESATRGYEDTPEKQRRFANLTVSQPLPCVLSPATGALSEAFDQLKAELVTDCGD